MRFIQRSSFLAIFIVVVTCLYGQAVHYNYDPSANFALYKTYQSVNLPGTDGVAQDQLIDQSIKRAVDEQLPQKGLARVDMDADLYVSYHAIIREGKGINLSAFGDGGGPWDWRGGWGGFTSGTFTGQTSSIPIGTLLVYDPPRKQLVWRGDGTKTIDLRKDPDKNHRILQTSMAKLFKNYPPQAGK